MDRLLFVDDENEIIKNYRKLFEKEKNPLDELAFAAGDILGIENEAPENINEYEVFTSSQGEDAIRIVEENLTSNNPIKVAFIDMRMPPGINGAETAKAISELDPLIEIVIVTAYSDIQLSEIVKTVGRADKLLYLKKPFDPNEVSQLAHNLTQKYNNERVKDMFLGNVSHELMTPLASIQGFSNLLLKSQNLNDEEFGFAKIISKNTDLMRETIEDLITIASLSRKSLVAKNKRLHIKELLDDLRNMSTSLIEKKTQITLDIICRKDDFYIYTDEVKLKQCLINLLTNALKFTEKGRVVIEVLREEELVTFSVKDTGIGISKQNIDRVFERFCRIEDEHHEVPGTGLGLSIVKEILDLISGKIEVLSELGVGTEFIITLPVGDSKE